MLAGHVVFHFPNRRYSLASSSNGKRQNQTTSDQSHTENAQTSSAVNNNNNNINDQPVVSLPVPVRKGSLVNKSNGFICAEWAAKLNHDDYDNNNNNIDNDNSSISRSRSRFVKQENTSPSPSPPPPPPAFLGAGDACANPTNTLPSPSHSSHPQILQQSQEQEQGSHQSHHHPHQLNETSWSISNSNNYSTGGMKPQVSNSYDVVNSDYKLRQTQPQQHHQQQQHQVNQVHGTSPTPGYSSHSYQNVDTQKQLINELRGFYRNSSTRAPSEKFKNFPNSSSSPSPPFNNYQQNPTTNRLIPLTTDQLELEKPNKINNSNNNTDNININNHTYASSKSSDGYRSCGSLTTYQGSTSHYDQERMIMMKVGGQQEYCEDNNDNNNNVDAIVRGGVRDGCSGGSWTPPDHAYLRRECHKTNSSLVVTTRGGSGSDGLSNSMSPESSLSDKSGSEANELNRLQMSDSSENNQRNKLVVRVFRPDKTTKAILIDHHMTAGEVASMMIEKNFLQPSIHLALVEKVPALKIERVFEEHDLLSDCILAWPTKSQNMIFFEERPDHFGLVESPDYWIGEDNNKQGFRTAEAIQTMLNDIDSHGFPEWRDYLFIRKPGDKSWSRRLCILRSSGLYTSNKNKKNLSSTDLIRILVLDGPLKLYTTTGGWTRMRAPTPHGFAFKPYSAQDPASTHVFCFCATDEKALRHWICRLRIAKYGRQLLTDYHMAISRVHQLISLQTQLPHPHHPDRSNHPMLNMNLQSKSSCDYLSQSSSSIHTAQQHPHPSRPPPPAAGASASVAVLPTGSSTSLLVSSSSPSVFPSQDDHPFSEQYRYQRKPDQYYQYSSSSRQSLSPNIQSSHHHHPIRPVSPLMGIRARMSNNNSNNNNNTVDHHQSYNILMNHNPASEQLGRQNRFPVSNTHHPMERYK
ncbi:unnamed protein product [Trichobilharzia szidati]|nr:unnamed protein product [Trichobilharzia szidati]